MTDVSRKMLSAWWLLNYGFSLLLSFSFLENGLPGDWRAWLYGVAVWLTYALVYILPAIALSYLAWRLFYRRWPRLFWMLAVLLFGVSYLL
ncbi:hypothetical protein, partial [Thiolapillus sp.]